jgi:hypothetical protein
MQAGDIFLAGYCSRQRRASHPRAIAFPPLEMPAEDPPPQPVEIIVDYTPGSAERYANFSLANVREILIVKLSP